MKPRALQVRDLFGTALDLPEPQREQYLREACGDDDSLRLEVSELLTATHAMANRGVDFLEPPELAEVMPASKPTAFGPYRVQQQLDANAWLGRDLATGRVVRIEVLPAPAHNQDVPFVQFVRQAHGANRLISRVPVNMREHGLLGDSLWIAMEHVPGPSLADELLRQQDPDRPGPRLLPSCMGPDWLPTLVALTTQLAQALAAAHQSGLAHGELCASRILLEGRTQPRLLGFGCAALRGRSATAQDDIKALGALVATMHALHPSAPADPNDRLLRRILDRSRTDRGGYASMDELLHDLHPDLHPAPTTRRASGLLGRWFARRTPPT